MNDFSTEYAKKLIRKEDVISLIRDGDRIVSHGGALSFLGILDDNIERLHGVKLYTMFMLGRYFRFLEKGVREHIVHHAAFVSPPVREAMKAGEQPEVSICHFSETDEYVRSYAKPTVLGVQCTPMDEDGYFYMGYNSMGHQPAIEMAERVIVHVNPALPKILGDCNKLHISRVTAVYEEEMKLDTVPPLQFTEADRRAAQLIAERIPDGATIQIGVGRVPDAMTPFLQEHRHLGVHTEVFTQSLMDLMKAGVIDNSRKTLLPGKTVFSFTAFTRASQEIYDFVDGNPATEMYPISFVNDPRIIAQNDNLISVNSALSVDLTGQVCSEALGFMPYSGTGGQLDFVRGARWSKGGRSYIVINSVAEKRDGSRISKIDLTLPTGSPVTTPRTEVDCIVTEYGVAELRYKSIAERAAAMIAVAHPDFRDELTAKAKKAGYFI